MADVVKNLKAARELISDPARWTQHTSARSKSGNAVGALSPNAVCFCALGAVQRATKSRDLANERCWAPWNKLRTASFHLYGEIDPSEVNDVRGHSAVLEIFDRAIADAEASHAG